MNKLITTRRATLKGMAAGIVALGGGAFGAFAQTPKKRIYFANYSDEVTFGALVLKGFKEGTKNLPGREYIFLDNRFDAARAIENARVVAAAKPDLFIEYNIQAAANLPISRMMSEAGVKVLAIQAPVGKAPLYAVDNPASGISSGEALAAAAAKKWPGETPVIVLIGLPEAGPLFLERADGAKKSLSKVYPNEKFIEFSSKSDSSYTRQVASDMLTRFQGRKILFWVHLDGPAMAVQAAIRNAKREADCFVSTTGGDPATFAEIRRRGSFLGTYSFFPELWAGDLLPVAEAMLEGKEVPARIFPKKALFINADNIDQHYPS